MGTLLYHLGLAGTVIRLRGPELRVVAYHACGEYEGDGLRGLDVNVHPAAFARHLEFFESRYRVTNLDDLLQGTQPANALLITFDDGYRSVHQHALPLMGDYGMTGCVYVISDTLEPGRMTWVNELAWLYNRHYQEVQPVLVRRLGEAAVNSVASLIAAARGKCEPGFIEGLLSRCRRAVGLEGPPPPPSDLYLNRNELSELAKAGWAVGNHTASHPDLTCLDQHEVVHELERSHEALAELPGFRPSLAYPFGATDPTAEAAALRLSYTTLMAVGGWNDPLDMSCIARVPGEHPTPARLFAEIEIVAPTKNMVRRFLRSFRGTGRQHRVRAPANQRDHGR